MSMKDVISQIRAEKGLTQEQMTRKLYVTRQAVSLMATMLPHLKRWAQ